MGDALGSCEAFDVPANCEAAFEVGAWDTILDCLVEAPAPSWNYKVTMYHQGCKIKILYNLPSQKHTVSLGNLKWIMTSIGSKQIYFSTSSLKGE